MTYQELIVGAGESLGIPGMIPDDAGEVTIADETYTIEIGHDEKQDRVTVRGIICAEPENGGGGLYRMLLAMNFSVEEMRGATLAVYDGGIFLCRSDRVEGLSVEVFVDLLQNLADSLARFRADIEAFLRVSEITKDSDTGAPESLANKDSLIIKG